MYKIIGANQAEYGPVSTEQLRQWITEGRVNAQTLAQAVGETGWKPISSYPDFAGSFPSAQAAPPPPLTGAPHVISGAPPAFSPASSSPDGRAHAENEVSGPAIGLMVVGALGIANGIISIIIHLTGITFNSLNNMNGMNNPQMMQFMQFGSGALGIVFALLKIILGIFVIFGALKMKALQQHSLAIGAGIVAVIPCISPCCCVGIPIGIWALIVLNKPEVRSYFS
jgi:GYF domain 2